MAATTDTLTNLTQAAQDVASSNVSASAIAGNNITEEWTIGPDGEFDGDPEEPRFAVLVFYCILAVMIGAQSGLFYWKKQHKRSYELVTLMGLWLVPMVISVYAIWWRFVLVWLAYSGVTGYMLYACSAKKRMASTIPRLVYVWFLGCHKACVVIGILGYALLILEGVGLGLLVGSWWPDGISLMFIWYGLYYGVLGRDLAEVAGNRMVATMGTRRKLSVSVNSCGICGGVLKDNQHLGEELAKNEKTVQLTCKHLFHDQCIRGWTLVGKKDTCPVCLEKVDLRALYADRPWDTRNLTWIQMLDAVRYMVVWNPVVILGLHFALHALGVDKKQQMLHEHSQQLHQLHMNMTHMNDTESWNATATDILSNLTSTF